MDKIREILGEIGLSSYKIETYLALLKIKSGRIQEIAKVSKVPSCKLYENLRWLHENGYITIISQKPLSYRANDPKSIIKTEIERRKEKLEELNKGLDKFELNLPVAEKEIIQITTTREAYFKKIKESVRGSKQSISYIAKHWRVDSELVALLGKKTKEGVVVRALGPINSEDKSKIDWLKNAGVKIKNFEPKETHFAIYDGAIVVISLRSGDKKSDYSAIWIKSEVLGKILGDYFDVLWGMSRHG